MENKKLEENLKAIGALIVLCIFLGSCIKNCMSGDAEEAARAKQGEEWAALVRMVDAEVREAVKSDDFEIVLNSKPTDIRTVSYYIEFNHDLVSLNPAYSAADAVLKATLRSLVNHGRKPAQEFLTVSAWSIRPFKGETGQDSVRVYLKSRYDFNRDIIEHEKAK